MADWNLWAKVAVVGGLLLPDFVITFDDLSSLFRKKKKTLLRVALFGAALGFFFVFFFPPLYKIEASFKEKPEQANAEGSIRDLFLQGLSAAQEPEVISLMRSREVLKAVVTSCGLQMEVRRGFFIRLLHHLYAEMGWRVREDDWFVFNDVEYEGEEKLKWGIKLNDGGVFQVWKDRKIVGVGEVGKRCRLEGISFILESVPKVAMNKMYSLQIAPWTLKVVELRKKLKIVPQKTSKSIYDLTLFFKDRKGGKKVLDCVMGEYRNFLKNDHDQTASEQIAYLEKKQQQFYEKMSALFEAHASLLKEAIGVEGFFSLEQEIKSDSEMRRKILSIDLELGKVDSFFANESEFAKKIGALKEEKSLLGKVDYLCSNEWMDAARNREFDLETSRALSLDYAKQLEESRKQIEALSQIEDLELNACSGLLQDPMSQELIANATALTLKLQDEKYSSFKERLRWSEDLALQKKSLKNHVADLVKTEKMGAQVIQDKMEQLQKGALAYIDQEISVLSQHLREESEKKKEALLGEKRTLEKKLERLTHLPERWKGENWFQMKTELGKEVMTLLTQLVESKTVSNQLFHIESKPLDAALASRFLENSHLMGFTLLGGFCFPLLYFGFYALISIMRGLPLSSSALQAMKLPFSGLVSDPETMCKLSFFSDRKVIALFGGRGSNYSHLLVAQLTNDGKKVLLIENFSTPLCLKTSENVYDAILLWYPGNFHSAKAMGLLKICEKAIITITSEQREELTPLLHWAYHDGNCRITFIYER